MHNVPVKISKIASLEEIKRVNPQLFRKATTSKTLHEFLNKMGTPKEVSYEALTKFYNKVNRMILSIKKSKSKDVV